MDIGATSPLVMPGAPCGPEGSFSRWKAQALGKADLSKKGSVDQEIAETVRVINLREGYFTTSSCSGRIILIDEDGSAVQKQNCSWLFVTHQLCALDDLLPALHKAAGDAVLKFEPFVLHVQCRTLEDAQLLHNVAIDSGFRNSGITVGKKGKIIMAVRSTHCLEVPLSHKGKCLVSGDYVGYVVQTANQKMEENFRRIARFHGSLLNALRRKDCARDGVCEEEAPSGVYTRRRRRNKGESSRSEDAESEDAGGVSYLMI
ncbi:tRNA wybutosine-synthesizing protein 3 homolog isoform X2 [Spea bombifrons]|uniref:tRNA wybutosine-synthesizing protein 3 homolog isoform X2 n=1 Tax=Spea bombifrons TaxID=233779 RepID=UPI00234A2FED|nr:tRNA wybutosine-synthesizing protein 3 homolog isoform X2 [Spea bombifrons]